MFFKKTRRMALQKATWTFFNNIIELTRKQRTNTNIDLYMPKKYVFMRSLQDIFTVCTPPQIIVYSPTFKDWSRIWESSESM